MHTHTHQPSPSAYSDLDSSFLAHLEFLRVSVEFDFRHQIDAGDGKDGGGIRQKTGAQSSRKIGEVIVTQRLLLKGRGKERWRL